MFTAQVYKVQIVCLSGIMEEVCTAQEVISKHNQENAERTGKMFFPLAGDATANNADVVIGIVGNYIEKVEVIEKAMKVGKEVLLFFSKYQDPKNTIPAEGKTVEEFKKKMESKCDCYIFSNKTELREGLAHQFNEL